MKTIRISDEVYDAITALGKFRETDDDVLRRVFKISPTISEPAESNKQYGWKERRATHEMRDKTGKGNTLVLEFDHGPRFERAFPAKHDRLGIRKLRDDAVEFVQANGGTQGQKHAAIKALTSRGYHVAKVDATEYV